VKKEIRALSIENLITELEALQQPKFRAKQIYEWLWNKSCVDFEQMSNLSKELRNTLQQNFYINHITENITQKSNDGTIKMGFKCQDDRMIEGVMIPADNRMTACVSSQVGCSLSCKFCATGFLKRERNLEAGEIYDQVVLLNQQSLHHFEKPLTNIVYMGMGEPLLNYDNVMRSINLITTDEGLGMSSKRITVSTSGVARGIMRMADEGKKFNLALSLHAATDEKRLQIMDINKSNPLDTVIDSLSYFYNKTGNKITYEYILFKDFNDSDEDAKHLIKLCKKVPSFVNIIEYNQVDGVEYTKASDERLQRFTMILEQNGIDAKVRRSRGKDIDAACGQLANKNKLHDRI
jgi:23S rRNA (adenine2503-C2)-methyltransferase